MKKLLLSLLLIVTSMEVSKLSAYCTYNWSKNEKVWFLIYASKPKLGPVIGRKSNYSLKPGGKGCWNWKEIAKSKNPNKRTKEWYWKAYNTRTIWAWTNPIGEGYFPIGGAIAFKGYDQNARAIFQVFFDKKSSKNMPPWKYRESPWNHSSRPWKTYKR